MGSPTLSPIPRSLIPRSLKSLKPGSLIPQSLMQCYNRLPHHQRLAHTLHRLMHIDCRPQQPIHIKT